MVPDDYITLAFAALFSLCAFEPRGGYPSRLAVLRGATIFPAILILLAMMGGLV